MKFLYYILHTFIECPDKDLEWKFNNAEGTCKKCGRIYLGFTKQI